MPRLSVRLPAEDLARVRAVAELRGVPVSDVLRAGVRAVAAEAFARAVEDARGGGDRRQPREAYTDGDVRAWAAAVGEHGERRAARWPERRGAKKP